MSKSNIEVKSQNVRNALQRLADVGEHPDPALKATGEDFVTMVKQTFADSASPEGVPWAPNSQVTILAALNKTKGNFRPKDGKLSTKGAQRVMGKKPLIGESKALMSTIFYDVDAGVLVQGTPRIQGAMMQFGGSKADYSNLWGNIPARPFEPVTPSGELMPIAEHLLLDNLEQLLAGVWRD